MSLLDDLRNLLARHLAHVKSQTNQGVAHLVQDHFDRLEAVASNDIAAAEAKVHEILGELYAALNAPAGAATATPITPITPAPAPAPETLANPTSMAPAAPAAPEPAPVVEAEPAPAPAEDTEAAPAETSPAA